MRCIDYLEARISGRRRAGVTKACGFSLCEIDFTRMIPYFRGLGRTGCLTGRMLVHTHTVFTSLQSERIYWHTSLDQDSHNLPHHIEV